MTNQRKGNSRGGDREVSEHVRIGLELFKENLFPLHRHSMLHFAVNSATGEVDTGGGNR